MPDLPTRQRLAGHGLCDGAAGGFRDPAGRAGPAGIVAFGERWFCADCGTPLAMLVKHQPDTLDFTIATLDEPGGVVPGFHIWESSRIGWFETSDNLPRHDRFRPDTVGLTAEIAQGV